jgi:uncharacterized membrane protein
MVARSESSFPQADLSRVATAAAVGIALFAVSWVTLHHGPFDDARIVDTGLYAEYAQKMLDGEVPYRDFSLEYPPGALLAFLAPTIAGSYVGTFEFWMLLLGCATVALVAYTLIAAGASPRALYGGVALVGISPLLLGPVILSRFDLWPVVLVSGALAAVVGGRPRLGFGVLGAAVAVKLYPVVLLPLALLYVWSRRGRREAFIGLGIFEVAILAIVGPFALIAPDGVLESVTRQTERPLQLESLGSAVLLAAHRMHGYDDALVVSTHGSQNLSGPLPDTLATVQTVVQALAVVAVWLVFARSDRGPVAFLVASAAAVTAFVAFGKVLSPQFMIWLLPLVPLVVLRRGVLQLGLFAASLVVTQLWFPGRYWEVAHLDRTVWLVLLRDGLLVALFLSLLPLIQRARAGPRTT